MKRCCLSAVWSVRLCGVACQRVIRHALVQDLCSRVCGTSWYLVARWPAAVCVYCYLVKCTRWYFLHLSLQPCMIRWCLLGPPMRRTGRDPGTIGASSYCDLYCHPRMLWTILSHFYVECQVLLPSFVMPLSPWRCWSSIGLASVFAHAALATPAAAISADACAPAGELAPACCRRVGGSSP